jgi:NtrC-family two-component system response regulator AlgB
VGRTFEGFDPGGWDTILKHGWPGNLRELRNAIERAAILAKGPAITASDLPVPCAPALNESGVEPFKASIRVGSNVTIDDLECAHIRSVLDWAPSLQEAAEILGIDKATLYRKRKRLDLD